MTDVIQLPRVKPLRPVRIERARLDDVDELLKLFFTVYGATYPLALGTDRAVMTLMILDPQCLWLVARDLKSNAILGSMTVEIDAHNKIGRAEGLVVHPEARGRRIAQNLLESAEEILFSTEGSVNSFYTTTRTLTLSPQIIFLKHGFIPLGIFPNAHKLRDYETLTLFAKYRPGFLARRSPMPAVPESLGPILSIMNRSLGLSEDVTLLPVQKIQAQGIELDFELIFAPSFVKKRFYEAFQDPYDRFYPFHQPNLLISSTNGEVDIYAYYSKADGYCTIVALTQPCHLLAGRMRRLLDLLRDFGVSYIEILMGLEHTASLEALLNSQFLPSAVYPAMREHDGLPRDFVLMSRTMEPLDFRGMQIERAFKPYVDQYVDLWKKMHLDVLGVFDDYS